jgi:hypothetical protein
MKCGPGLQVGVALLVLSLSACSSGKSAPPSPPAAPVRGTLLQNPPHLVATLTVVDLLQQLNAPVNVQLLALSGTPLCDIGVFHLEYHTVGARSEATTASAALLVPAGLDARCHGARPIVLYAHGTSSNRAYNIADLNDPQNAEGLLLAALFASQGYIVVAPNYAGYDTSTLGYHPYLNADQQSKDMIDALSAARQGLPAAGLLLITDGGQLFITGYSQGGYVALATQRALQAAGMTVTAAAPMSGPYALAAFFDAVMSGQVDGGAPVFMTLLITGYQKAYGNIYAAPGDLFEDQYASGIDSLLPSASSRGELYAQGLLPQYALFSATPPDPIYADITPATQPARFASVFALGFGSGNLIRNSYRLSYLQDLAGASAQLPLRQALARNDLRNWVPTAPTLLCGGDGDPIVFWLNTQLMQDYWATLPSPATDITVLNLEAPIGGAEPFAALKQDFVLARQAVALNAIAQGASDGGERAVFEAYHATLVAPFCLAAVREFFASHQ